MSRELNGCFQESADRHFRRKEQMKIYGTLIEKVRAWLGKEGKSFFKGVIEKHGNDWSTAVLNKGVPPHPIHFREGMTVRNFLREQEECKGWSDHDFDNRWGKVIEAAVGGA